MKKLILIAFIPILLFSCKKRVYHSFTDDERAFLVYEAGETFKLKNENTGEILELFVTSKSLTYKEDFGPKLGPSRKEHLMEEGRIEFTNPSSPFEGYIYIYKDKIDQFALGLSVSNFILSGGNGVPDIIESIGVNGVTYENVYVYEENGIWFSKTHGFIHLENYTSGEVYTIVP